MIDKEFQRAVRYGDGFFETMRYHNNKIYLWEWHWERIIKSASYLQLELGTTKDSLLKSIDEHIKNCAYTDARIRISFIRNADGYYVPESNHTYIHIESSPLPDANFSIINNGFSVGLSSQIKSRYPLSNIKSLNALPYVLAGIEAKQHQTDECILLNDAGRVCEGYKHSIFIRINNRCITPALTEGCIYGVMRRKVLNELQHLSIDIEEGEISLNDLSQADEIIFTNIISGVQFANEWNGKKLNNQLCLKLNEIFKNEL
jgi:branched-chain amino acid aminotransferase